MLKFSPAVAELTVMVPVASAQVGCEVTEAVGAEGVAGCVFTVAEVVAGETQPLALRAVTVYVPADTPGKMPVLLV